MLNSYDDEASKQCIKRMHSAAVPLQAEMAQTVSKASDGSTERWVFRPGAYE